MSRDPDPNLRRATPGLGAIFFDGAGRTGRGAFVASSAVLVGLLELYDRMAGGWGRLLTGWVVHPVLLAAGAAVASKRLHDRGRSGWWAALVLAAFVLVWPEPRGVPGFVGAAGLVWTAWGLGLRAGQPGFNRYGPRPGAPRR